MNPTHYRPLRMAEPAAGGGGAGGAGGAGTLTAETAFAPAAIAPEYATEASFANMKTVGDLAKGYLNAQKLIGAKRVAIPAETASDAEWDSFYNQIGRPETHDKYEVPDAEKLKVDKSLQPDPTKWQDVQKQFHKLGLTARQARGIAEYYMTSTASAMTAQSNNSKAQSDLAVADLQKEWGDQYKTNLEVANSVIRKFGDEKLLSYLSDSGMGNNTQLAKLMHKIGVAIMDDRQRGGGDNALDLNDQAKASREIETLKTDAEFQKILTNSSHAGHKAAVSRWTALFAVAHPGKVTD